MVGESAIMKQAVQASGGGGTSPTERLKLVWRLQPRDFGALAGKIKEHVR